MLIFIIQTIFIGSIIGMLVIILRKISALRNLPVAQEENLKRKEESFYFFHLLGRKIKYSLYRMKIFFKKRISFGFWRNFFRRGKWKKSEEPELSPDYWQKIKEE